jgi:hypothetical protein
VSFSLFFHPPLGVDAVARKGNQLGQAQQNLDDRQEGEETDRPSRRLQQLQQISLFEDNNGSQIRDNDQGHPGK